MLAIQTENRISLLVEGYLHDAEAAAISNEVDVPADRKWLHENPHATFRERPASIWELRASGLPPGTVARVSFQADGGLRREFGPPRRRRKTKR